MRIGDVAFWSRYVTHYLRGGLYKSKGLFAPHISRQELIKMLPDYEVDGTRDRRGGEKALWKRRSSRSRCT